MAALFPLSSDLSDFFIDFIESHFWEFTSFCHSPNFCECCFCSCSYFVLFLQGFLPVILSDGFWLFYSDYARNSDGLDLFGLGLKPHRIGSHRFHRFPQIFLTYAVLGWRARRWRRFHRYRPVRSGISQILGNLLITCRILAFFLVVSKKKRNFAKMT